MKKLIILLMAGLMIMPACQNSLKENANQTASQIKLLSQSLKENSDQTASQIKLLSQSLKENSDQTALQTKLLSQSVSKLSSSVCSLQQKASDDDNNKKFPTLSICPKSFPFSVAIPSEFLLMFIQTAFSYPVWLYNVCKDYFKGVKK